MNKFFKPIQGQPWTFMARSTAMQLKEDNQIEVANWCSGQLKGMALKEKNRVIQLYCKHRDLELKAGVGDWIVRLDVKGKHSYLVYPDGMFQALFQRGE